MADEVSAMLCFHLSALSFMSPLSPSEAGEEGGRYPTYEIVILSGAPPNTGTFLFVLFLKLPHYYIPLSTHHNHCHFLSVQWKRGESLRLSHRPPPTFYHPLDHSAWELSLPLLLLL